MNEETKRYIIGIVLSIIGGIPLSFFLAVDSKNFMVAICTGMFVAGAYILISQSLSEEAGV